MRSFESAVYDLLTKAGRRSDYLVYGVAADRFDSKDGHDANPYPTGSEREFITKRIGEAMFVWKTSGRIG